MLSIKETILHTLLLTTLFFCDYNVIINSYIFLCYIFVCIMKKLIEDHFLSDAILPFDLLTTSLQDEESGEIYPNKSLPKEKNKEIIDLLT